MNHELLLKHIERNNFILNVMHTLDHDQELCCFMVKCFSGKSIEYIDTEIFKTNVVDQFREAFWLKQTADLSEHFANCTQLFINIRPLLNNGEQYYKDSAYPVFATDDEQHIYAITFDYDQHVFALTVFEKQSYSNINTTTNIEDLNTAISKLSNMAQNFKKCG